MEGKVFSKVCLIELNRFMDEQFSIGIFQKTNTKVIDS